LPTDQELPMPTIRPGATPDPTHPEPTTVTDVVALLDRYAAADQDLAAELDRIGAEASAARRVSQATVTRLVRLLDESLVPGVQAKVDLAALPSALRQEGVARWARQVVDRLQPRPAEGTA